MSIKNFVVKNGLTVGLTNIDAATGNLNTGNANLGNLAAANFFSGNANALFNIQGANVVGTVPNANVSVTAGTVTTNAQPNITSVGTLSSLAVSGNANVGGILTDNYYYANGSPVDFQQAAGSNTQIQFNNQNDFGASANFTFSTATNTLTVTGNANVTGHVNAANINSGTSAFALTANGFTTNFYANGVTAFAGNVSAPNFIGNVVGNITGNIAAAGANTQIQFNDDGILGGNANFTFNKSTSVLTVAGNIVSNNANLGNLATANYVNVANELTVSGNSNLGNLATANYVAGTLTTAAQPNITSVGTLSSLTVSGNVGAGNVNAGNLLTANYVAGTLTTAAQPNITSVGTLSSLSVTGNIAAGNANLGNLATANFVAGTLTTAAQPNITSVGTLTDLTVTGNIGGGNVNAGNLLTANYVAGTLTTAAQPNVTSVGTLSSLTVTGNIQTSANLVTDLIVGRTTSVSIEAAGTNQNIFLKPSGTGSVDVWSKIISNVATPVAATDAATKGYVDAAVEGLHIHAPCVAATPDTLANVSSGTVTYNNGTAGVGATLTTTGSYATIDGVNIATLGTRILVKNEANAAHNGIYVYTSGTVLTRASDFDTPTEMGGGDYTFVQQGTLYNDTGWVMADPVVTVGTTPVVWLQFSGAGTYTAGTGLTLNGTQFSISNTAVTAGTYGNGDAVATFTVNAQGQLTNAANTAITANAANLSGTTLNANILNSSLTSVGTLGSLAVTGNATAGNVYANSGTIGASLLTGTLTTAAQPNVTSVGTLSSLSVTGNANVGNIGAAAGVFTTVAGSLTTNAQPNITSVGTLTDLTVTGNVSANNFTGANLVSGNFVAGTLTTAAQPNITSVGTLSSLSVTGNATAGNVYANSGTIGASLLTGTLTTAAQPNVTSIGTLTDLAVTGNATAGNVYANTGTIGASLLTGTLTTAAQPNITSVGTLSSLSVTGNASAGNLSTGGTLSVTGNANVGNIGTAQVLATANVTTPQLIANIANGTAPILVNSQTLVANLNADLLDGYNTAVGNTANTVAIRNADGNLSANYFIGNGAFLTGIDTSLIANGNSNVSVAANGNVTVSVSGNAGIAVFTGTGANISGTLNVTGNANVGNIGAAAGVFTTVAGSLTTNAQPNITSVGTLASLAVTGLLTAGNVYANSGTIGASLLTGTLTTAAQPNITSVGNLSNLTLAANGNINMSGAEATLTGANLVSANLLTGTLTTAAQPNVTSVGTLTSLTTSGNVVVGGNVKVQVGITSNRANVAVSSSPTVIDEFAPGSWRTAKYVISGSGDDGYQSVEALLVHDGSDAYITIYGSICSNNTSDLINLSSNINGVSGNVTVYANSASDNCYVNLVSSYIKT